MEVILEIYEQSYDPQFPWLCLDEKSYQLLQHMRDPIPPKEGQPAKEDYEYKPQGTCNLFMLVAPKAGWRDVKITDRRTAVDYAQFLKELVDVHFPEAQGIRIIQDNLNTYKGVSLEAFIPSEARRILRKLEFPYTPKHASWLNMAKIELSILGTQCVNRRIANQSMLRKEIRQW